MKLPLSQVHQESWKSPTIAPACGQAGLVLAISAQQQASAGNETLLVKLPGLCRGPAAGLSGGTAMASHRAFHQTAKLRTLAPSLTPLEVSSKFKGVALCLWVLKRAWHRAERAQPGGPT